MNVIHSEVYQVNQLHRATGCTDQEIARRTNMDPHSIGENRVNVSIRNFQSFFDAFNVKEGDPIFTVKANVGRADLEQAKVDLRKYTDTYEEQRELVLDHISICLTSILYA